MSAYHTPVLLDESVSALVTDTSGVYADATFGGGGHSAEILSRLSPRGRLIAFDRDSEALQNRIDDERLTLVHADFRFIRNFARYLTEGPLTGVLADLGVSSHQFDSADRGFSFRFGQAPLDMRMNGEAGRTAADIVNSYEEQQLERVFRLYGEVENSRALARFLVRARTEAPIRTSGDMEKAIEKAIPAAAPHKYLAKVYQALRIEVNDEMRSLEKFLQGAAASLSSGGRLVVITYHSLEDRMVKNFIKTGNVSGDENKDSFGRNCAPLRAVNRKPILPSEAEIQSNTRARSAKLRIAEKV